MEFFSFAALFCLKACVCCIAYATFRVLGRRFPLVLKGLGWLGLMCWMGGFSYFAFREEFAPVVEGAAPPYPLEFVTDVGVMLLITLAAGGVLLRYALQKQWSWWRGVLFSTLYLGTVYVVENWGLGRWGFESALSQSWLQVVLRLHFWPLSTNFVAIQELVNWSFPLGAPIAEIVARSFKRASAAHRDESFA